MFGGLNRLAAAALVASAAVTGALTLPSAALACNGGTSAVNVYKECLPSGGGGKATGRHARGRSSTRRDTRIGVSSTPAVSRHAAKALKHAGKDRGALSALVHDTAPPRVLQSSGAAPAASEPTALGSAFDLGSGPTALLIVLVGTGILLLAAGGVRGWRRSHRA